MKAAKGDKGERMDDRLGTSTSTAIALPTWSIGYIRYLIPRLEGGIDRRERVGEAVLHCLFPRTVENAAERR